MFAPAPAAGQASRFYRPLGRYASAFALAVDVALLSLGGALKRQEMISARFGDMLSELYLLSAVLKRWEDEGRQEADLPLVAWCMQSGFATIEARLDEIFANFPNRPAAWMLRFLMLPFGRAPSRSVRPADAGLRRHPHQALGRARAPHRRYLPRHRRRRGRAARARLRACHRGRAAARAHAPGARARHRPGETAGA